MPERVALLPIGKGTCNVRVMCCDMLQHCNWLQSHVPWWYRQGSMNKLSNVKLLLPGPVDIVRSPEPPVHTVAVRGARAGREALVLRGRDGSLPAG